MVVDHSRKVVQASVQTTEKQPPADELIDSRCLDKTNPSLGIDHH